MFFLHWHSFLFLCSGAVCGNSTTLTELLFKPPHRGAHLGWLHDSHSSEQSTSCTRMGLQAAGRHLGAPQKGEWEVAGDQGVRPQALQLWEIISRILRQCPHAKSSCQSSMLHQCPRREFPRSGRPALTRLSHQILSPRNWCLCLSAFELEGPLHTGPDAVAGDGASISERTKKPKQRWQWKWPPGPRRMILRPFS